MFSDFYNDLTEAAKELPGGLITEENAEKLYIHLCELSEKGKLFNLTAIVDMREATRKHVVDSLFAANVVREIAAGERSALIDIGSGGGFPSLPIAITCENVSVTALDSTAKKCGFISSTAEKCGVKVETIPERAEEASAERRETYDFAVARAVARLNILAEICAPFVKVGGYFLAMKGSAAEEERKEAEGAAAKLGLTFEKSIRYEIEDGGERSILVYKKIAPTSAEYPRRFAQIKKRPL